MTLVSLYYIVHTETLDVTHCHFDSNDFCAFYPFYPEYLSDFIFIQMSENNIF